jgi:hypothetical protein
VARLQAVTAEMVEMVETAESVASKPTANPSGMMAPAVCAA